ncbi:hypothetical protein LguiB_013679 [Lonicera macranthoides]
MANNLIVRTIASLEQLISCGDFPSARKTYSTSPVVPVIENSVGFPHATVVDGENFSVTIAALYASRLML